MTMAKTVLEMAMTTVRRWAKMFERPDWLISHGAIGSRSRV